MADLTTQYRPYPAYTPSGVPWLGDVPEHWEVRRLRTVADMRVSNVDKHTREDEVPVRLCNYVDVYKNDRITSAMPFMAATASRDEIERFRLESGDVLITKDSETWDDIGVPALVAESAHDLLSGYHLALLRPTNEILGSYLARTLQSKGVAYQFHVRANGVTRYGLTHNGIQSVCLPLPPLPEQTAIVRYLDHADRRIRRYVSSKRKLIALLEEERQAVVNRAVTRGLDPNVRLKPSGVEWLGDVPEHWEVRRLKSSTVNAVDLTGEATDGDIYLALEHVESWTGNYAPADDTAFESSVKRFKAGDVLFGKLRPYLAKVACPDQGGVCVGEFLVLRPNPVDLSPKYLERMMRSKSVINAVNASTFGAKMPRADWHFIGNMRLPFPPLCEQAAIVEHLDKATTGVDAAIVRARRQVELLQEYRTRLIADMVTGKLDVRDAAAQLPEGSCEEALIDEDGPLAGGLDEEFYDAGESMDELAIESEVSA